MWGRGFGMGFGRGWSRGFWGGGRGFGARLGYCPWTGLPRGYRWSMGYSYATYPYTLRPGAGYPYTNTPWQPGAYGTYSGVPYGGTNIESEAELLRKRLEDITKRIEELEGKK